MQITGSGYVMAFVGGSYFNDFELSDEASVLPMDLTTLDDVVTTPQGNSATLYIYLFADEEAYQQATGPDDALATYEVALNWMEEGMQ